MTEAARLRLAIRKRLVLEDEIRNTYGIHLQATGNTLKASCFLPNHEDSTPSFNVYQDKEGCSRFHCFGCKTSGDVVTLTALMQRVDEAAAMASLAKRLNIVLRPPTESEQIESYRASLSRIFSENAAKTQMLKSLGIGSDALRSVGIGYALGDEVGNVMPDRARAIAQQFIRVRDQNDAKRYLAILAGFADPVTGMPSYQQTYLLSLFDEKGNTIGATKARLDSDFMHLKGEEINPVLAAPLQGMSDALLGVNIMGELLVVMDPLEAAALRTEFYLNSVYLRESAQTVADVDCFHQAWKHTPVVTVLFSGDKEGTQQMRRIIRKSIPLLPDGCTLKIAQCPDGENAISLICKHGVNAIDDIVGRASTVTDYLTQVCTKSFQIASDKNCRDILHKQAEHFTNASYLSHLFHDFIDHYFDAIDENTFAINAKKQILEGSLNLMQVSMKKPVRKRLEITKNKVYQKTEINLFCEELSIKFQRNIYSESGERCLSYAKNERGLSDEVIKKYRLGYASGNELGKIRGGKDRFDELRVKRNPCNRQELDVLKAMDSGLTTSKGGSLFFDRLIFPISDDSGKIVSFSGRILSKSSEYAKYINGRESDEFKKGNIIYGLYEALDSIKSSGFVCVVEGNIDAVMLAQHGFGNAVACLGTALTPFHLEKLFQYTDHLVFVFDGDAAGEKASKKSMRAVLPYLTNSRSVRFATLSNGDDPDEYIRKNGIQAWCEFLESSQPVQACIFNEHHAQEEIFDLEQIVRLKLDLEAEFLMAPKDIQRQVSEYADAQAKLQCLDLALRMQSVHAKKIDAQIKYKEDEKHEIRMRP